MKTRSGIDTGLAILLENAPSEEIDYGFVMQCLKAYTNPRVKLHHLLKIGALVRVKKGIYIFGKKFARHPYSPEVLANMVYGPSYVSLEWACQYYHLIPERVTAVTSITTQRSRQYNTPLGFFTYKHLPLSVFPIGVTLTTLSPIQHALMATKEKALADLLVVRRGRFFSKRHLQETLFEDLRIDKDLFGNFDFEQLQAIYAARPHSAIKYLIQCRES